MTGLQAQQTIYLHSDNPQTVWKLKPQAEVNGDGAVLCSTGFDASTWVDAVVPGTAFNSYVVAGLEKDPNFGDNIHQVSRENMIVVSGIVLRLIFLLILLKT